MATSAAASASTRVGEDLDEEDEIAPKEECNVPFSVLMQQACTIKSKQNEIFRRRYDSWPSWLQHTMFATEEIISLRSAPYLERMKSAKDLKEKGNESLLHKHDFYEAIHFYENAMSLFHWIVNKKENWKKQEIEDDMLEMFEYQPAEETERKEIQELRCSCLLNFALASQKLFQWSDSVKACSAVLEMNPNSTKALYRRAQARLLPIQCGATENEMALQDLKKAYELAPSDGVISKLYFQVKKDLEFQKKKDLQSFGGLFERGTIYHPTESQTSSSSPSSSAEITTSSPSSSSGPPQQDTMTVSDALEKIRDMESAAKTFYRDGKILESQELDAKAQSLKKEIQEYQATAAAAARKEKRHDEWLTVDYSNPSPETIETAAKMGLDLTDPRVVSYLKEIQQDLKKREFPSAAEHKTGDVILDSIEAVHRNKAKEIATFICDGWEVSELDFLASYRLKYQQQQQLQQTQSQENSPSSSSSPPLLGLGLDLLTEWNQTNDLEQKRSLLVEVVTRDILETEAMDQQPGGGRDRGGGDGTTTLVMEMFQEKYGLKELEMKQKQKVENANSFRFWLTFVISGLFFCLLFIPAYLRSCAKFCDEAENRDCSSLSSFCFPYSHFFSLFFEANPPSPLSPPPAVADRPADEFHEFF